ncbi:ORF_61 [Catopsilia pomona nucleopolyhedrovirus]|uniref:ORF_61 n=1 Tax=Catopsilia pomona nucleopolyhedrovirus TaxID=1850906 RepID=A0A172WZD3_9ABAC|nr:ORF_61 [Catopsilia pomona nucleopolyhedrovirus]ANF29709.1 ORF_61 [Catopsilia pomona nucleopolyhedrovirus]
MSATTPPLLLNDKQNETTPLLNEIWKQLSKTETFRRLKDKNLTTFNKIKYDSELLLHYLYEGKNSSSSSNNNNDDDNGNSINNNNDNDYNYGNSNNINDNNYNNDINVIKIYKVKVKKTGGSMLAHYFAQINVSTGYAFEFHPGSQPRTFQTIHTEGLLIKVLILCDDCCKKELRDYIKGENGFNVAFKNCESILCRRISFQTALLSCAIFLLLFNLDRFSFINLIIIILILVALFCHNNYIISNPSVVFCNHKSANKKYDT